MQILSRTTIFTLLALAPVRTAAQNATTDPLNFNCSTFSPPSGRESLLNYTGLSNTTLRVSRADVCPQDADQERQRSCRVSSSGTINVTITANATDIPDPRILHAMLLQALRNEGKSRSFLDDFRTSISDMSFNRSGITFPIRPGTAGYVGFSPNMTCYDGVVSTNSSCSASSDEGIRNVKDKFEGRALQICVPRTYREGPAKRRKTKVEGEPRLVEVSVEEANREEMKVNPANNSSRPEEHYQAGPASPTGSVGLGGVGSVRMESVSLGLGVLVAVGMVGWM